jgi:hypothetical protein
MKTTIITVLLILAGFLLIACAGTSLNEPSSPAEIAAFDEPDEPVVSSNETDVPAELSDMDMVHEALAGGWWYGEWRAGFTFYADGTASQQFGSEPSDIGSLYGTYTITSQSDNAYLIEFTITDDMSKHEQVYVVNKTSSFRYNYSDDTLVDLHPVGADGEHKMIRHDGTIPR